MKELKITLKKSRIGRPEKHKRVLASLGLRRLNKSVIKKDTPAIRGMIKKVSHMIEIVDV